MDTEQVTQDLNRRFAEPLPEFYSRRIIVWKDEEREFEERLGDIELENAKIVALTGRNFFEVKKLLGVDDPDSNILLYNPLVFERPEDNWLLDVELYSEEFRADLVSIWMADLGIEQTPALRQKVREYRKFFGAQTRRNAVRKLMEKYPADRPERLQHIVIAAIAGVSQVKASSILRAVLKTGLLNATNKIYLDFEKYGLDSAFWDLAGRATGYSLAERDLRGLAMQLVLNAISRTVPDTILAGNEEYVSPAWQAFCSDIISDWMHSDDLNSYRKMADFVEDEADLKERLDGLTVEALSDMEVLPCVNKVILRKLMTDINSDIIDFSLIRKTVERRRSAPWYIFIINRIAL